MEHDSPVRRVPSGMDEAVRTFANRIARKVLLERLPDGHPVKANEENLVEMARSSLQELILCHPSRASLRPGLEGRIRRIARDRIELSDEDDEAKAAASVTVAFMDLSDLFPVVN